jgi:hypothetical protein
MPFRHGLGTALANAGASSAVAFEVDADDGCRLLGGEEHSRENVALAAESARPQILAESLDGQ